MKLNHMRAIIYREFWHILHDPASLALVTIGPVLLMLSFIYAMATDVENVPVAVVDHAGTSASIELVARLDAEPVMTVERELADESEINDLFLRGVVTAVIVIPEGYGEPPTQAQISGMIAGTYVPPQVSAIIDGTEPISAEWVLESVYQVSDAFTREITLDAFAGTPFELQVADFLRLPIAVESERLYNPDLSTVVDYYPGLAAVFLSLPALALALSLAKENEVGTLEQLVATPVNKRALLIGKMTPYLVFGMGAVIVLLVLGWVMFDVPFRGNLLAYLLVALLFNLANLGIGLIIAVLVRSQQIAMVIGILIFFLPPFLLTGVIFPVTAMPEIVRLELIGLPGVHFVIVARAIQLQGATLIDLAFPVLMLAVLSVSFLEFATFIFRKKVILDFSWRKLLPGKGASQHQASPQSVADAKGEVLG